MYIDNSSIIYIGLQDGSLKEIGNITAAGANNGDLLIWNGTDLKWEAGPNPNANEKTVTNELYFEDATYIYISMLINLTEYKVQRYSKANVNIEDSAEGSGTQPSNLTTVQGLTFN